jgi:hypothetical protein
MSVTRGFTTLPAGVADGGGGIGQSVVLVAPARLRGAIPTIARFVAFSLAIAHASFVAAQSGQLKAEYRQDFRDGRYDPRRLKLEGPEGQKDLVKPGRDGLEITVPPGADKPVGVSTKFRVRGDFEVTASFEVPSDVRSEAGATTDAELYLRPIGEWSNFASMNRSIRPEGTFLSYGRGSLLDGRRTYNGRKIPFRAPSGRFRIARTGSKLHYSIAEGDGEFREVFQAESWPGEVDRVRLTGSAKMATVPTRVVWKDLVIRAEALPNW